MNERYGRFNNSRVDIMEKAIREIATIIERDSKDTTYKFALLKGIIEICQEFEQYRKTIDNSWIEYPLGLLVLKWLEYYYPILCYPRFIPQKNGDNEIRSLAFRKDFQPIIDFYKKEAGFISLKYDLKNGTIPKLISTQLFTLLKKIKDTIIRMPMKYIGGSIGKGGEIFNYYSNSKPKSISNIILTENFVVNNFGNFRFPLQYEKAFQYMGYFMTGTESIIFKWVDFTLSVNENKYNLKYDDVLKVLYPNYAPNREVTEVKKFYKLLQTQESLKCVWSGNIVKQNLNIEHVLPYTLWKNNDLWNLLPSIRPINSSKGIKIPSKQLITKRQDAIIYYWRKLHNFNSNRFENEVQMALLGNDKFQLYNWEKECINSLMSKCEFLIHQRGYEPYNL